MAETQVRMSEPPNADQTYKSRGREGMQTEQTSERRASHLAHAGLARDPCTRRVADDKISVGYHDGRPNARRGYHFTIYELVAVA